MQQREYPEWLQAITIKENKEHKLIKRIVNKKITDINAKTINIISTNGWEI